MTQAQSVAIESSQINSSGVLLTTGGGTGLSTVGTNGQVLTSNGTTLSWVTPTTTSPGGSTGQVQYNNAGAFAGSANMVFDGSTLTTLNTAYTGTLTGGTGIVNLGSGQFYKDASGNVGIGTSSPADKLHVSGTGTLEVARFATITDNTPSIGIYSNGSIRAKLRASTAETALLTQGALPLLFGTNDTENMRIDSSGNVKLSTASTSILNSSGRPMLNQTGGILQTVYANSATQSTTTTTTYITSTVTASITPSSTSSKILVMLTLSVGSNGGGYANLQLWRNGSNQLTFGVSVAYTAGGNVYLGYPFQYLDSPASTSAQTYTVYFNNNGGGTTTRFNCDNSFSSITLMEIAQ